MTHASLEEFLVDRGPEPVWELLHENSKLGRHVPHLYFGRHPSDAVVLSVMRRLRSVKPFDDAPKIALPRDMPPATRSFDETLQTRTTARAFGSGPVALAQLSKVLFHAYGVTRDNEGSEFPRPFRTIPSGGALFPLEVYVAVRDVDALPPGLYHYDPEDHSLDELRRGPEAERLAHCLVQHELASEAAAAILISAVFFRSTFKYGDRGYRFVLLEAGHLAQNALLAAHSLGLAGAPIGGYLDRDVDEWLGLDGIDESTVYMVLIGAEP